MLRSRSLGRWRRAGLACCALAWLGCSAGTAARTDAGGSGADGAGNPIPQGPRPCPPVTSGCAFGRNGDPAAMNGDVDIINCASERLAAPPGGLWWIEEPLAVAALHATSAALGPVDLEVVPGASASLVGTSRVSGLRVPATLSPGDRVDVLGRALTVLPPLAAPLDLAALPLARLFRPELDVVGFTLDAPADVLARVRVTGYLVESGGNFMLGVLVLADLSAADAARLCAPDAAASGAPFFPMWGGDPRQVLGVILTDADDPANSRVARLARAP